MTLFRCKIWLAHLCDPDLPTIRSLTGCPPEVRHREELPSVCDVQKACVFEILFEVSASLFLKMLFEAMLLMMLLKCKLSSVGRKI